MTLLIGGSGGGLTEQQLQTKLDAQKADILAGMPDADNTVINNHTTTEKDSLDENLTIKLDQQTTEIGQSVGGSTVVGAGAVGGTFPASFGTGEDGDRVFGFGPYGDSNMFLDWDSVSTSSTKNIKSHVKNADTIIAVGEDETVLRSGDNGDTWSWQQFGSFTETLSDVLYDGSKFIACSEENLRTSSNSTDWTSQLSNITSVGTLNLNTIAFGNGIYVTAGEGSTADLAMATSTDAVVWAQRTSAQAGIVMPVINCIEFLEGKFWALGDNGKVATSTDGLNWTEVTTVGTTENLNSITYKETDDAIKKEYYALVGDNGLLLVSVDGVQWESRSSLLSTTENLNAVYYSQRSVVIVGDNGVAFSGGHDVGFKPVTVGSSENLMTIFNTQDTVSVMGDNGVFVKRAASLEIPTTVLESEYLQYNNLEISGIVELPTDKRRVHLAVKKLTVSGSTIFNFKGNGAFIGDVGAPGGGPTGNNDAGAAAAGGAQGAFIAQDVWGYGAASSDARGGGGLYIEAKEIIWNGEDSDLVINTEGEDGTQGSGGGGPAIILFETTSHPAITPEFNVEGGATSGPEGQGGAGLFKYAQLGSGNLVTQVRSPRLGETWFGDGSDGALVLTDGETFPLQVANYSSIHVSGKVLSPYKNLKLACSGTFTMAQDAEIEAMALGGEGTDATLGGYSAGYWSVGFLQYLQWYKGGESANSQCKK